MKELTDHLLELGVFSSVVRNGLPHFLQVGLQLSVLDLQLLEPDEVGRLLLVHWAPGRLELLEPLFEFLLVPLGLLQLLLKLHGQPDVVVALLLCLTLSIAPLDLIETRPGRSTAGGAH